MNKKVKFIAHLKINCNYDGGIEYENYEELSEKVNQIIKESIFVKSVEIVNAEEKENV